MKMRFAIVALTSAIVLSCVNIAGANVGNVLDVNKDNIIDETDFDIVVLHLNTYSGGSNLDEDSEVEFPFDDETLETLADLIPLELILYDVASIDPSPGDLENLWYRITWERMDTSGDGWISAIDAVLIANWINSH